MAARPAVFFGVAVVLALGTTVLVVTWLGQRNEQPVAPSSPKVMAAVAVDDLPYGTKLAPERLRLAEFSPDSLPEGHFTTVDGLKDRVLQTDVKKNEPILNSKLIGSEGIAGVTGSNKRAMAVKVDEVVGVGGFIKPSDRVDVMVTIQQTNDAQSVVAKVILENIRVLAAGTQMVRTGKDEEAKPVQVITLEVDVVEAEKLALASTQGKLRLALRNPRDGESVLTEGARVPSLLSSYRSKPKPTASRPAEPSVKVEVVHGGTLKEVKF
jgi:pilus assembly protein CpaB